jgi:hypothetical protein
MRLARRSFDHRPRRCPGFPGRPSAGARSRQGSADRRVADAAAPGLAIAVVQPGSLEALEENLRGKMSTDFLRRQAMRPRAFAIIVMPTPTGPRIRMLDAFS